MNLNSINECFAFFAGKVINIATFNRRICKFVEAEKDTLKLYNNNCARLPHELPGLKLENSVYF